MGFKKVVKHVGWIERWADVKAVLGMSFSKKSIDCRRIVKTAI
jgi:hypothetical protein